MIRIACFGDSNTYGYDPRMGSFGRYPDSVRWTGRLNALAGVSVRNHGINGAEIPLNGVYVSEVYQVEKPDVIILMFGSNDVLERVLCAERTGTGGEPGEAASRVAARMERYVSNILDLLGGSGGPEIILIAPPAMSPGTWTDPAVISEMKRLAPLYREIAKSFELRFLDASSWPLELCFDGVHLTEEGHRVFYEKIKVALAQSTA